MLDLGNLPALDVALGLAFLYFLLSTVCSAINEAIATVLGWRAKTLEHAVANFLADGPVERDDDTVQLGSAIFEHWRIKALVSDPASSKRRRNRPSYLPPRAFSLAVAETLAAGPADHETDEQRGKSPWELADEEILARVRQTVAKLPDAQAKAALQKAVVNAGGTLEGFRRQLETGFDDSMERASGWYKRKVQLMIAVLAAALTFAVNIDSMQIASRLWSDKPLRTAVAQKAAAAKDAQSAADAVDSVDQLKLPLGWGAGNAPSDVGGVLRRIPGWLITIAALSLGAPFWFDLLSRVARLRGSGVPQQPRSLSDTPGAVRS